jgi:hypothetical protein
MAYKEVRDAAALSQPESEENRMMQLKMEILGVNKALVTGQDSITNRNTPPTGGPRHGCTCASDLLRSVLASACTEGPEGEGDKVKVRTQKPPPPASSKSKLSIMSMISS